MTKPLVIYHADCTDGFGAAFAAWLKLGDEAEYRACAYGQEAFQDGEQVANREVYILDFSFPRDVMDWLFKDAKRVIWLDHHKTAFEMWCPSSGLTLFTQDEIVTHSKPVSCHIILNNNKSGALLAWDYFHACTEVPMLIRHIDDRDRWQFRLDGSKELHAALASYRPWSFRQWDEMFVVNDNFYLDSLRPLYREGTAILRAQDAAVSSMAKQARKCSLDYPTGNGYGLGIHFREGLACNSPLHQSELGHVLATQSGTFGLVWYLGADNRGKCSLRSNGDYDVSAIAKAFGGGGHRNAAGFETDIDTLMGWLK